MANRRTINDVISYDPTLRTTNQPATGINPAAYNNWQNQHASFVLNNTSSNMSAAELRAENQKLKNAIQTWRTNRPVIQEQILDESGIPGEFNKRIAYNDEKIRDLEVQLREQEEVIAAYQAKFAEFEDNLNKVMRLDKDIHSKLVNPQQSSTLEKNVKNVMVALNSGASYEQILHMIESIRV